MCREDLQLGRGRKPGKPVVSNANANSLLPANGRRVALLVSFQGFMWFDSGAVNAVFDLAELFAGDSNAGLPVLVLSPGCGPVTLRIEDVGQLICGSFSVSVTNSSANALIVLTEITTNVEADAITR